MAASPEQVHTWITNADNIKWGLYHVPSLRTVKDHLKTWDAINSVAEALTILDRAKCEFGRESLFEVPTNLNTILQKAGQTATLIVYIMESLLATMLRRNAKIPFTTGDLKDKGATIDGLLGTRKQIESADNG